MKGRRGRPSTPPGGPPGGGDDRDGAWIRADGDGVRIRLKVQPGARSDSLVGVEGGLLRLRVAAPPVEGAANDAVIRYLAREFLAVAPSRVRLVRGLSSREKEVSVDCIGVEEVKERVSAMADPAPPVRPGKR